MKNNMYNEQPDQDDAVSKATQLFAYIFVTIVIIFLFIKIIFF